MFLLFFFFDLQINWHTIYWSVGLQFILAVLVMRWQGGKDVVLWIQARLDEFFANSEPASKLIFGDSYRDHYMAFGVSSSIQTLPPLPSFLQIKIKLDLILLKTRLPLNAAKLDPITSQNR